MFKRTVVFLALGFFVFTVATVCAEEAQQQPKMMPKQMFKEKMDMVKVRVEQLTKDLSLTPEQQQKIKDVLAKSREDIKQIFEETKAKVKDLRVKAHDEISNLLTPEQKAKFMNERKKNEVAPKIEE